MHACSVRGLAGLPAVDGSSDVQGSLPRAASVPEEFIGSSSGFNVDGVRNGWVWTALIDLGADLSVVKIYDLVC